MPFDGSTKAARAKTAVPTRTLLRIGGTFLPLELDRHGLRIPVRRLLHDELLLREPRDVAVQHGIPDPENEAVSVAVLHQGELVGRAPHDAHELHARAGEQ